MIQVHFFAQIRERLGCSKLNLEYAGQHTVDDIRQHLLSRGEDWQLLQENNVLIAVNQSISTNETVINDGDEIAFFPPVTGG